MKKLIILISIIIFGYSIYLNFRHQSILNTLFNLEENYAWKVTKVWTGNKYFYNFFIIKAGKIPELNAMRGKKLILSFEENKESK